MAQDDYKMRTLTEIPRNERPFPKSPDEQSKRSSITARETVITVLHTSLWPIVVFGFYAAVALASWIIICVSSKRPIRFTNSYYHVPNTAPRLEHIWSVNEKYIRTARIIQTIAVLLAIPVTSAMACVVYVQSNDLRKSLSLRKTLALADQGWASPAKVTRVGCLPLFIAFGLTIIGSISQILQSSLTEQEHIKVQGGRQGSTAVSDVLRLMEDKSNDGGILVHQLRALMESTTEDDYEGSLWNVTGVQSQPHYGRRSSSDVQYQPQYVPRISSFVEYVEIADEEFRRECRNETERGGFYAQYTHSSTDSDLRVEFNLTVCMTNDLRISPWKATRDRQDITETLYLNINTCGTTGSSESGVRYKSVASSSLGYFELPSAFNGNKAGPLLDKYPSTTEKHRKRTDDSQTLSSDSQTLCSREDNNTYSGNESIMATKNKGPLAAVVLALFAEGSFISKAMNHPSSFVTAPPFSELGNPGNCAILLPLTGFLGTGECIRADAVKQESRVYEHVRDFIRSFTSVCSVPGSLNSALFMSNKLWMSGSKTLAVEYDAGLDTFKPKISQAGIVAGSVFLALHLFGLLLLALYAAVMKP
ncbi:hypothetical protein BDV95DRAFT_622590 [Massariosphaeria phaeospora]|uniref:Uncharacterized protein n=1 Tax=Massariosphaeria phaeospora TaxID=100035 RepID=A0A7C8I3D9_9PLEO|nr:hypothetical protein BDV95DRAFT_622590 [Massariosphaeria phaeospora]